MQIHQTRELDVVILKIEGALLNGPQVAPFHDEIRDLQKEDLSKIVVDLSGVTWFGSAMLGVLVASLTTVKKSGGDIRLSGVSEKVREVFEVTFLDGVFLSSDTVEEAVKSYKE